MFTMIRMLFSLSTAAILMMGVSFVLFDYSVEPAILKSIPWDSFFSIFGMLYAIISGFLLITVLNRHSELSSVCELELNAIEDVRDFLVYIDGEQEQATKGVKEALLHYVDSIIRTEWPLMRKYRAVNSDTSKELYDVMRAIDLIQVTNESDRVALRALIDKVSEITSLRTKRLELAVQKLPLHLRMLTVFMSIVLVIAIILQNPSSHWLHLGMVGVLTIAVDFLHLIIADLDRPFSGLWVIEDHHFETLKEALDEQVAGF